MPGALKVKVGAHSTQAGQGQGPHGNMVLNGKFQWDDSGRPCSVVLQDSLSRRQGTACAARSYRSDWGKEEGAEVGCTRESICFNRVLKELQAV